VSWEKKRKEIGPGLHKMEEPPPRMPPPKMEDIFYILFTWGQTLFNEGITGIGATLDYNFI
jgi:hypothetical protein